MKTPDYWIKREKAWQAQQIKDDKKTYDTNHV